jgi:hypothetical protein
MRSSRYPGLSVLIIVTKYFLLGFRVFDFELSKELEKKYLISSCYFANFHNRGQVSDLCFGNYSIGSISSIERNFFSFKK